LSQLSSSEKRLKEAQRLAKMGSWTWQGSDVTWSEGMYQVLEMCPKSKIFSRAECFAMIHAEDLAKAKEADKLARSGPGTYYCRYRVIVGRGIVKTLDWICTTEIASGKKLKFSGVLRDVSDQVATEAELARLASIIENSTDFISIRSLDGTIQYMNPTARRIAKGCSDVLGPGSYYPAWAAKRVMEQGIPYALEHSVWVGESALLIDGEECPTSQLLIAHRDSNGRNERISTIVRDIGPQKRLELELRQSEEKLRQERDFNSAVRETAGSLIVVLDPSGIIHSFNSECSKLSGLDNAKAIGSSYTDLLVPSEQRFEVGQIFESVRADGILRDHEHWWLTDSIEGDQRRLISWRTTAVTGHPGWIVTTGLDITEKRAAELAQRETETRLQRVAESMSEALIVQMADGKITVFNPAAEAILMTTADQLMGKASPAPNLKFVREDGTTFPVAEYPPVLALKTGVAQRNVVKGIIRSDGSLRWCVVNSVPLLRESDGKPYAVVTTFFDATELKDTQSKLDSQLLRLSEARTRLEAQQSELKKANAMLRDLADSDPLTGLKNRRFLLEYLENEIVQAERYEQPVSLMMIDVDDFKKLNDVYGHAKGDDILVTLGTILVEGSRKSDRICRFGSDEFVIVLSRADEESSLIGAERIRSGVENNDWAKGEEITVSIGLVTYGGDLKTSSDLLSAADVAM
jgi:diguanylate cyclase (GGDEF)-like protein/PAS domain S-box-containing protein